MTSGTAKKAPTLYTLVDAYLRERMQRHEITPLTARNFRATLYNFRSVLRRPTGDQPEPQRRRELDGDPLQVVRGDSSGGRFGGEVLLPVARS